jgi:hypothetical protein
VSKDIARMKTAAQIGILLFGIGAFAAIAGWLPVMIVAGTDAAIVTAIGGIITLLFGATLWLFCMP